MLVYGDGGTELVPTISFSRGLRRHGWRRRQRFRTGLCRGLRRGNADDYYSVECVEVGVVANVEDDRYGGECVEV
ncbi:unnamed protein product [Sphagnum troendelagicum]|uniref:Uncharacterized protein n=1 Tax=Sphagnum troendelagicum TaxID=128251 RepID=A0ABP0TH96_9BRYO